MAQGNMVEKYTTQVTTRRSYETQERAIYEAFLADYGRDAADAIAKTNTAFQLKYMSTAEAVDCLVRAGIGEADAIEIVVAFSEARAKAEIRRGRFSPGTTPADAEGPKTANAL